MELLDTTGYLEKLLRMCSNYDLILPQILLLSGSSIEFHTELSHLHLMKAIDNYGCTICWNFTEIIEHFY